MRPPSTSRVLPILALFANMLCCTLPGMAQKPVRRAPELAFRSTSGQEQLLSSFRGKVVSLEFIYTTCMHCQQASQVQRKLQQTYADRGFQAIDVAINQNADLLIENFGRDFHLNFPVGWTTPDQALTFLGFPLGKLYVVPQIVVIDRAGYIRAQTTPKGDDPQADAIRSEVSLTNLIGTLINDERAQNRQTRRPK